MWSDSAKWSRKTIDGKCDGYMGGLGGTKKRKYWKSICFQSMFEGLKEATGTPKKVCNRASRTEKVKFLMFFDVECFVYISRIVLPAQAGSTFSEKSHKKGGQIMQNGSKMEAIWYWIHQVSSKRCQLHEAFIKIMSDAYLKSCKEATCNKNTRTCKVFWGLAWEAWRG